MRIFIYHCLFPASLISYTIVSQYLSIPNLLYLLIIRKIFVYFPFKLNCQTFNLFKGKLSYLINNLYKLFVAEKADNFLVWICFYCSRCLSTICNFFALFIQSSKYIANDISWLLFKSFGQVKLEAG